MEEKKIIVLTGPTAVGKTASSLELASLLQTEIISADSRQIYKEMHIGTAKPDAHTLSKVPHHLIDCVSIHDKFTTGDYMRQAREICSKLFEKTNHVIVTGGTGLYIKALLEGINEFPEVEESILVEIEEQYEKSGLEDLQKELREKDPLLFEKIDIHNSRRVIRALSVIRQSGKPYSYFAEKELEAIPYKHEYFVLQRPREELYERINMRVEMMLEDGLLAEARKLYPHKELRALQTVGYQELFDHFDGKMSEKEAIEKIKQHTRNYAKRQLTWFRGVKNVIEIDAQKNIIEQLKKHIL